MIASAPRRGLPAPSLTDAIHPAVVFLSVGAVTYAVALGFGAAGWLAGRPAVLIAPLLGLGLGLLLARWRALPSLVAHWVAILVAGGVALWLVGPTGAAWESRAQALATRLFLWLDQVQRGTAPPEPVLTTAAIAGVLLLLAHKRRLVRAAVRLVLVGRATGGAGHRDVAGPDAR